MNWGLMAGGVSKGLESALEGANKGLVQGEQIRHQRAGEGLQQEHLGLQQQQLQNTMAQQDFMNRLARERFGFDQQKFGADQQHRQWQERHGDTLRDIQAGEYGLKREAFPYERDKTIAQTNYYNNPLRGQRLGGHEAQYKNAKARALNHADYYSAPLEVQQQIDKEFEESRPGMALKIGHAERMEERYGLLNRLAQQKLLHPGVSAQEKIQLSKYMSMINQYGLALKRQQDAILMGTPLDPQTAAFLASTNFDQLFDAVTRLGNASATRGLGAYNPEIQFDPVAEQANDIRARYGLTPRAR